MAHIEDLWRRSARDTNGIEIKVWIPERDTAAKRRAATDLQFKAVYHEPGGKRRSRKFRAKPAAEAFLAKQRVDLETGQFISRHETTVEEFGERWLANQIQTRKSTASGTRGRWTLHIKPLIGELRLMDVEIDDIQDMVNALSTHYAPATVHLTYGYVKMIFNSARAKKLIHDSPCVGIVLPRIEDKQVVPLTKEQVMHIASTVPDRLRAMVLLGAASGMRGGEMRGLTLDRLTWHPNGKLTVRINRQAIPPRHDPTGFGPPKTARSFRSVTLDARSAAAIRKHIEQFPPREPLSLLFTGTRGEMLSVASAAYAWKRGIKGLGITGRSGWHELRHFHASMLISAGVSVTAVADRLGHKDSNETLKTYSHLWHDDASRSQDVVESAMWGEAS